MTPSRSVHLRVLRGIAVGAALFGGLAATPASAQVYRCESDNGVPVYQGTPNGKNCRALDLQPLITIPAPRLPASKGAAPGSSASGAAASRGSPEGFPRVDAATQRARDGDRRGILSEELKKEEAHLAELESVYKGGEPDRLGNERNYQRYLDRVDRLKEEIARTQGNIAAIRRELGNVKD